MAGPALDPADILATLDDEQREVALALRGPVRVLAGAGTGKTRAVIGRIAYGVSTGTYAPESVMAVTFTQRAAGEMRTRLRDLGVTGVVARTFHASALRQLNYFWPQITGVPAPRILESKGRVLGEVAQGLGLRLDTAALRDVAADIEWRKVNNLSVDAYATLASRPQPAGLTREQIHDVHAAYEKLKDDRRQIDFEDVLLLTVGMLEAEPRVSLQVQQQYRFFNVDEYQDVSPLQHRLLELWRGDRQDVCVVGDASQTIFSFTGASPRYLLDFETEFPRAVTVRLEHNYRSTAPVVALANSLMRGHQGALELRVDPTRDGEDGARDAASPLPTVSTFPTERDEAYALAAKIRARIAGGIAPESIAVLYRTNAQSAAIENALLEASVPYHVFGSTRFFDRPEVRQAILGIQGSAVVVTDEPLFQSVGDVLRSLGWTQDPPEAEGAVRARWEALNAIADMADAAAPGTTLREFTQDLKLRADARYEPPPRAVTLASLHSAKGLEWDEVYIVGLSEGLLPISYATTEEAVAEERRLLYVGITRARRTLALSLSTSTGNARSSRERSRFLAECGTNTLRVE